MSARFEVVRTADRQWHARFIAANGRLCWWTENYRRKVGAENAIDAVARVLDARLTGGGVRSVPGKVPPVEVRYIDDRLTPVARPELPDLEPTDA